MTYPDDSPVEWVDEAPAEYLDNGPSRRPPTNRVVLVVAAVAVLAAVLIVVKTAGGSSPTAKSAAKPSASPSASTSRPLTLGPPQQLPTDLPVATSATPVTVSEVGHPLLGVTSHWTLYGLGANLVVRIELSNGRITTTQLPSLASDGPITLLANSAGAIVRPWDVETSFIVPDGQPAASLSAEFSRGGASFPGPDSSHVWVQSGDLASETLILVDLSGKATGATIPSPANGAGPNASDETGGVIYSGAGGVYDAQPSGLKRITTGAVLAIGPTRWLTAECDDHARCVTTVIDRASGAHRSLGQPSQDVSGPIGAISPDGLHAAVFQTSPIGQLSASIMDLQTGVETPIPEQISSDQVYAGSVLAWSPDSKWLFLVNQGGQVAVVNVATHATQSLGITLPNLNQLALRAS